MAKSIAELERIVTGAIDTLTKRVDELKEQLQDVHRELELVKQRSEDQKQHIDKWDGRIWTFGSTAILALIGMLVSILVAFLRK